MVHPISEVLHKFGKFFSHLWGFIIFSKSALWDSMSCLLSNSILPLKDVLFMNTKLINNTWKYIWNILQSFFTSLVFSLIIPLSIFLVHACEKYLVARSLFCIFPHGIRASISTWYQSSQVIKIFNLPEFKECIKHPVPLWKKSLIELTRISSSLFCVNCRENLQERNNN